MRLQNRWKSQAGWSVMELVVVAGMIALIMAGTITPIQRSLEQYRLDTATYAFAGDLQLARVQALKRNASVTVNINANSSSWGIAGVGTRFLPRTISFSTQTPASVGFDSRGRSTSTTQQSTTLSNSKGQSRSIVILPSGKVTVN